MEIAFDTTQSEAEKRRLKRRLDKDKLIVDCVRELYEDEMLESAIPEILQRLGEFMEADQIMLCAFSPVHFTGTSRWSGEPQDPTRLFSDIKIKPLISRWLKQLQENQSYIVENIEELKTSSAEE